MARGPPARHALHFARRPGRTKHGRPIWGAEFAEESCRARTRDSRATLWLGPDEYLLLGFDDSAKDSAAAALESGLADAPHALVDISHRQFGLEVTGPHAEVILNGACPLDLSSAEFPVGMCTRTVLAKAISFCGARARMPSTRGVALVQRLCHRAAPRNCSGVLRRVSARARAIMVCGTRAARARVFLRPPWPGGIRARPESRTVQSAEHEQQRPGRRRRRNGPARNTFSTGCALHTRRTHESGSAQA